jgi:glutamyl-tRNA reductase
MQDFLNLARTTFQDLTGLFILATCNRTEIYFESTNTSADMFCNFLLDLKSSQNDRSDKHYFRLCDDTNMSVEHLLEVAAGLPFGTGHAGGF